MSGNGTGYPTKQAILNSPCFDLSSLSSAFFNFEYHMYGSANMGSLALEASDDDGATWTSIWSNSGNNGNSWLSASVDLGAFLGGSVQLRLNTVSGTTWQGDIAVDDISLTDGAPVTDICDGVQEWVSGQSYQVGDRVTYQGSLFERTSTGWTNLGTCGSTAVNTYSLYVDDPAGPFSVDVYPNPVKGRFLNLITVREDVNYRITNLVGQQISEGKVINKQINVDHLKLGVYLVHLNSDEDNTIIRFIKE